MKGTTMQLTIIAKDLGDPDYRLTLEDVATFAEAVLSMGGDPTQIPNVTKGSDGGIVALTANVADYQAANA